MQSCVTPIAISEHNPKGLMEIVYKILFENFSICDRILENHPYGRA